MSKKRLQPDPADPLKVRRFLALWICLYAFLIWPHLLLVYWKWIGLPVSIIEQMLVYVGTLSAGPIGFYLWSAHKMDRSDRDGGGYG